ncbi:BCLAF1 and THRAP3 family member 3 isoform X2 [Protopterus annectens]|uniref:BCLAF1 and THRAP3 family member 3 isoform X2 n=1 Tax=Protopterus annectens TaxID=7888 RepID=UPI001CFAC266|nr:BCLAF1 and THRAP3 family member 3 isoform X2 [Protopterus annectens]
MQTDNLSQDLVATNKKRENFHPVFDHLGSTTQTTRSAPTGEFTQEIITLVHQVKENYFKPSKLSLHERFSQLEDENKKSDVEKDTGPEIHRRIDISLTELQSKKTQKSDSTKATSSGGTIDDPNDLRHDIERRRKERLHDDDGHPGRRKPDKHEAERNKRDSSSRPDDHVAEGSRKVAKGSRRPAPFLKRPVRRIAPLKKIIRKPFTNAFRPGEPNSKPYPPPRKPFGEVRGKLPKFRKPFQAKLRPRFPPLKPPFSRKRPFEGHPEGPTSRPAFLRKRPFENMHDGPPPFKRFFKHNLRPQRLIGRPVSHIVKQSFNIQSKYWRLRGDHSRGRGSRIFRGGFERKEGVFAIRREPQ